MVLMDHHFLWSSADSQRDLMEPTHDSLQAQGNRQLAGTKARGRPACSWEFMMCLLVASIPDKEDLWVRFAVLFSLMVINQQHTHLPCSIRWRLTGMLRNTRESQP